VPLDFEMGLSPAQMRLNRPEFRCADIVQPISRRVWAPTFRIGTSL
jgi:hypothetical protein